MRSRVVLGLLLLCMVAIPAVLSAAPTKEITVMIGVPAAQPQILEDIVTAYEKRYPDVKVSLVNGADQKVLTAIASGLIPDVATINNNTAVAFFRSGLAYDLTGFIRADNFDTSNIPPNYESMMYQGRWYGMPQAGGAFADRAVFYNRDIITAAGLGEPTFRWTWETFATYVQKLSIDAQNDGVFEQIGYSFSNLEWPIYVWSGGGEIFNDARTEFTLTKPAAVEALDFWASLSRRGWIAIPNANFGAGQTAMRTGAYFETRSLADRDLGFDWSVVELPRGVAGSVNRRVTHPWIIPIEAKYPKEGWDWIKLWLSDEIQADLVLKWNWRPPQTATIARQLARTKYDRPPYTYAPFMGINCTSKPLPIDIVEWDQINTVINQALTPVWSGEQSVLGAMTAITPHVMSLTK